MLNSLYFIDIVIFKINTYIYNTMPFIKKNIM